MIDLHAPNSNSANFSANTALWVRGIMTKIVSYYMKNLLQGSVKGRFTCPLSNGIHDVDGRQSGHILQLKYIVEYVRRNITGEIKDNSNY